MQNNTVKAKTYWTWTKLAEAKNPTRSIAGKEIWPHYRTEAPAKWLEDGLIQDASEVEKDGQVDLFDILV
ncbi:hypothetical protein BK126_03045 [Paenibacillus sp. FSL H7-0326]|nr:hypothetical protein BK126_03045 [Paenibacillus sp. FSL H7-0326]